MKKEKKEKKFKIDGRKIFGKVIALLMLIILLVSSLYSLIFLLINQ